MEQEKREHFKNRLLAEQENIESDLKLFATQDPSQPSGWSVPMPPYGDERADEDEATDAVEEFEAELSLEQNLVVRLKDIAKALENIEKGTYGTCERCGKEIDEARLNANPEARAHTHC